MDDLYPKAFDSSKSYLLSPPVLGGTYAWQASIALHRGTRAFTCGTMCLGKLRRKGNGPLLPKSHIGRS